ncbi:lengsin-like [Amphiura filiformis]|uniref:lengsin-like n=1 Tax=Amphiura filiformis TaxID=82378 RepID=UPI003B20E3AC
MDLKLFKDTGLLDLLSAHEHEFYVADQNTLEPFMGRNIRSTIRNYKDPELVHQLLMDLSRVDVDVETYESEYDPGQLEITYTPSFGIKSPDTAHTFRTSVKEIASQHGICSGGANPYIILAATVAAGIDGIKNQMEPPPQVNGHAYVPDNIPPGTERLPSNMKTAMENLSNDNIICEALGDEFVKCFVAHKLHELCKETEAKAKGDSDWERNLFFEYL